MRRCSLAVLSLVALPLLGADEQRTANPVRPVSADLYGDPLPPGALARMGSLRLRPGEGCFQILFSADGKELLSLAADGAIRFWDPETGRQLRVLTVPGQGFEVAAVSPDGKTLAACGGDWQSPHSDRRPWDRIYLWDARTHERRSILHVRGMGARCLAFSPDGKTLASAGDDKIIHLWDVEAGTERRKLEGREWPIIAVAFSPDGSLLASRSEGYVTNNDYYLGFRMWDMASGKTCWQTDVHSSQPVVDFRFLPDGRGVDIRGGLFRVLNAKDGKELRVIDVDVRKGILTGSYIVSADGKTLIACMGGPVNTPARIALLSLVEETDPEFLEGDSMGVTRMALSPDGKTLATVESPFRSTAFIRLWDVTAKRQKDIPPGHKGRMGTALFLPDGKTLVTGGVDDTIRFWDAATGKERRRLGAENGPLGLLGVTPDGAVLALRSSPPQAADSGRIVLVRDRDVAKELPPLQRQEPKKGQRPWAYMNMWALSPDGKTLAAATTNGVQLWEVDSGKAVPSPDSRRLPANWLGFSPDGETLAVQGQEIAAISMSRGENERVHLWDLKAGTERMTLNSSGLAAFAPDARLLACGEGHEIRLRDALTGRLVSHTDPMKTPPNGGPVAFSPDGKLFAMSSATDINGGRPLAAVLETATCQAVCLFDTGGGDVEGLAFAPDGVRLASALDNGTALVWDLRVVPADGAAPPARLDADALALLWDDLDARDAAVAYRAVCALAASPAEALGFLKGHVAKAPPRDAGRIHRLIADLNSDDYEAREAASRQLKVFGPWAEADLKEAASSPVSEINWRAKALLTTMDRFALPPGRLREIRAIQVLERIGTPEARRVLEALAEGEPAAPLTRDALAALGRHSKQ